MRNLRPPIDQAVTQRLINLNRSLRSVQTDRPRGCQIRFRRKIQTQRNAELALFPVGVLFSSAPLR